MENYFRKGHYQDDNVSRTYDEIRFGGKNLALSEATNGCLSRLLKRLDGIGSVFDMPCGTGRFVGLVKEEGIPYVGGDISMEMMFVLRGKHSGSVRLIRCDAANLPFKDNEFDCVLCFKFLSLVPREVRIAVLPEIARVAGRYLIAQSKYFRTFSPLRSFKLFLAKLLRIRSRIEKYEERGTLTETVENAGLKFCDRELVRPGLFSRVWPFDHEYLAVFKKLNR